MFGEKLAIFFTVLFTIAFLLWILEIVRQTKLRLMEVLPCYSNYCYKDVIRLSEKSAVALNLYVFA